LWCGEAEGEEEADGRDSAEEAEELVVAMISTSTVGGLL